jgi:hypothetical protein
MVSHVCTESIDMSMKQVDKTTQTLLSRPSRQRCPGEEGWSIAGVSRSLAVHDFKRQRLNSWHLQLCPGQVQSDARAQAKTPARNRQSADEWACDLGDFREA